MIPVQIFNIAKCTLLKKFSQIYAWNHILLLKKKILKKSRKVLLSFYCFGISFGHVTKLQLSIVAARGQESLRNSRLEAVQLFGLSPTHSKKVSDFGFSDLSCGGDFSGGFSACFTHSPRACVASIRAQCHTPRTCMWGGELPQSKYAFKVVAASTIFGRFT